MHYKTIFTLVVFLFSLFFAESCFAHKVRIFAWSEGETIYTESKFSGGKPAQKATVTVVDHATGKEILRGVTDQKGLFQFPAPESGIKEVNIVVNSGDGHKNNWLYQLEQPETAPEVSNPQHQQKLETTAESKHALALTKDELREIIDKSLEKKLAPIERQLAEQAEQGPDIKDILGGIGYILGLAGIAAYMKSKKQ